MSRAVPGLEATPAPFGQSASTALVTLEPDGFVSAWSAAAERLYGRSAAEMVGRLARELCSDAFQANHDARFERARDGLTDPGADTVHHHALGYHLEVHITFEPLFAADGRVRGVAMAVGVSERTVRTVQAIERDHALQPVPSAEAGAEALRLLESLDDHAVFWLDPAGRVRSWSRAAERVKGHGYGVIGKHFGVFYPPALRAAGLPAHALEIARRDGRFVTEGWRVRADGSQFWASATLTPMRSPDGALLGYAKVVRDAGARRAFEAQSWRTDPLSTGAGERTMVTDACLDESGPVVLYLDEEFARLLGSNRETLVGYRLLALLDDPAGRVPAALRTACATASVATGSARFRGEHGVAANVEWRAVAIADGSVSAPVRLAWTLTPKDEPTNAAPSLCGHLKALGGAAQLLTWLRDAEASGRLRLERWGELTLEAGVVRAARGETGITAAVETCLEGEFRFDGRLRGPTGGAGERSVQHLVVVSDLSAALAYAGALGLHRFHATVERCPVTDAERVALCSVSLRVVSLRGSLDEARTALGRP